MHTHIAQRPAHHRTSPRFLDGALLPALLFVTLIALIALIAGCATAPQEDSTNDTRTRLIVESDRAGEIYVDGALRGNVVPGEAVELAVEPGPHVVSLPPPDGEEAFQRVSVEPGQELRVRFRFGGADAGAAGDGGAAGSSSVPPSRLASPSGSLSQSPGERDAPDLGSPPSAPSGTMVVRTPEGVYEGEIVDGLPHGSGTMTWDDGAEYRGQWQEGRPHGSGVHTWPNGSRYVGEWRNGRRHGVGKMEWANGTYYEGAWKKDLPNGRGYMEWPDGSSYEGELVNGRPHGVGGYREPDGLSYEGSFEEGRATGGVLTVPTGEQYWATMDEEGAWNRERPLDDQS
ncbi:MAG: hypothetical protein GVY29_04360 [Spirochaetes bacterium]|jgi:hypothetical protein|nr:hypothetical protein [Spirochaetota bacterium]